MAALLILADLRYLFVLYGYVRVLLAVSAVATVKLHAILAESHPDKVCDYLPFVQAQLATENVHRVSYAIRVLAIIVRKGVLDSAPCYQAIVQGSTRSGTSLRLVIAAMRTGNAQDSSVEALRQAIVAEPTSILPIIIELCGFLASAVACFWLDEDGEGEWGAEAHNTAATSSRKTVTRTFTSPAEQSVMLYSRMCLALSAHVADAFKLAGEGGSGDRSSTLYGEAIDASHRCLRLCPTWGFSNSTVATATEDMEGSAALNAALGGGKQAVLPPLSSLLEGGGSALLPGSTCLPVSGLGMDDESACTVLRLMMHSAAAHNETTGQQHGLNAYAWQLHCRLLVEGRRKRWMYGRTTRLTPGMAATTTRRAYEASLQSDSVASSTHVAFDESYATIRAVLSGCHAKLATNSMVRVVVVDACHVLQELLYRTTSDTDRNDPAINQATLPAQPFQGFSALHVVRILSTCLSVLQRVPLPDIAWKAFVDLAWRVIARTSSLSEGSHDEASFLCKTATRDCYTFGATHAAQDAELLQWTLSRTEEYFQVTATDSKQPTPAPASHLQLSGVFDALRAVWKVMSTSADWSPVLRVQGAASGNTESSFILCQYASLLAKASLAAAAQPDSQDFQRSRHASALWAEVHDAFAKTSVAGGRAAPASMDPTVLKFLQVAWEDSLVGFLASYTESESAESGVLTRLAVPVPTNQPIFRFCAADPASIVGSLGGRGVSEQIVGCAWVQSIVVPNINGAALDQLCARCGDLVRQASLVGTIFCLSVWCCTWIVIAEQAQKDGDSVSRMDRSRIDGIWVTALRGYAHGVISSYCLVYT